MRSTNRVPDAESVIGKAARYHNEGLDSAMIAERMNVGLTTVYGYLSRARYRNMLNDGKPKPAPMPLPVATGELRTLVRGLPPSVASWLVDQVPDNSTLTDLLRAMIIDFYYDDPANTK
jgi:hypothetical protein